MAEVWLNGRRFTVERGDTLFAAADAAGGTEIANSCPRMGTCRECIVEVREGWEALSPPTEAESFLLPVSPAEPPRFRLACQARVVRDDARIEVEAVNRRLQIVTTGRPVNVAPDPWIRRAGSQVFCDGRPIGTAGSRLYGVALDVGTTTVVAHLVDLESGETLARLAFENPQKYGGSSVMHRISFDAVRPGCLQRSLLAEFNRMVLATGVDPADIWAVTVTGNPTMRDLFFGLSVQSIGCKPFKSITQLELEAGSRTTTSLTVTGQELGLMVHPRAVVYGLPIISHHVGADMAAVLLTLPDHRPDEAWMVVDIGTNTEVVAGRGGRMICVSCPAGPAFEGGRVSCGSPAVEGAISHLRRRDGDWELTCIGDAAPRGVCGSGLVDLLGELLASGEMDALGRFRNGQATVTIHAPTRLGFTRRDASELAQAKGANGLGQLMLLRKLGIGTADLDHFYLAGAFANHIDLDHARRIGLILAVPDERIHRIGNASVEGARAVLVNRDCRRRVEDLVRGIEHVEPELEPDFFELYAEMLPYRPIG